MSLIQTPNCMTRNDTMKRAEAFSACRSIITHSFFFLNHKSTSLDIEVKTHWNTFLLFECVSPQQLSLSVLVVLYLFDSVPWIEEARQLGLVWKQCLKPIGMWNKSLRCPSSARSECPKAKNKGIRLFFCLFSMSVQSYSKRKQQGSILTADQSGGGGQSLLAAWCSPLTWSRPNHNHPADDMQWSTI